MVNPAFVERDGVQLQEELPGRSGFNAVVRPSRAIVKGLDRHGAEQTVEVEIFSPGFQHEMTISRAQCSWIACGGSSATSSSAKSRS
jgi:peptide deformylase